jgi:hypothetical protein
MVDEIEANLKHVPVNVRQPQPSLSMSSFAEVFEDCADSVDLLDIV